MKDERPGRAKRNQLVLLENINRLSSDSDHLAIVTVNAGATTVFIDENYASVFEDAPDFTEGLAV